VEDLPKSPIGKILRRTLRDEAIGKSPSNDASKGA
jgi:acyl-coenzyme A synthetase/AMP-(fatty) acid ligase